MIPLSVPNLSGNEWKYIKECLDTNWVSSVGSFVEKFENVVAEFTGAKYAVSVSSGTSALHISLMLAGVERGDLVIVPNLTFVASINSIKYVSASPILIDVYPKTWQMDLDLLEEFLNKETTVKGNECFLRSNSRRIKAVMPVHILGNMCDMEKLIHIAENFKLSIVEDATEALGSKYKQKHAGTFGVFGCFSFNGNKIITTGGGGVIVSNDEKLAKRAKHITTQAKADPFEYYHDEVGYNYRLVNVLAAMGVAQMEQLPTFLIRKKQILELYKNELQNVKGISFQHIEENVNSNNWLVTVLAENQKKLMEHLLKNKIQVRPFWVPMNQLPINIEDLYVSKGDVADSLYKKSISLPCSTNIIDEDIIKVCRAIKEAF